jgi:hypothetical protein
MSRWACLSCRQVVRERKWPTMAATLKRTAAVCGADMLRIHKAVPLLPRRGAVDLSPVLASSIERAVDGQLRRLLAQGATDSVFVLLIFQGLWPCTAATGHTQDREDPWCPLDRFLLG